MRKPRTLPAPLELRRLYYVQNLSLREIGDRYGRSRQAVMYALTEDARRMGWAPIAKADRQNLGAKARVQGLVPAEAIREDIDCPHRLSKLSGVSETALQEIKSGKARMVRRTTVRAVSEVL